MQEIKIGQRLQMTEPLSIEVQREFIVKRIPFPIMGDRITVHEVMKSQGVFYVFCKRFIKGNDKFFFPLECFELIENTENLGISIDESDSIELVNEDLKIEQ
jgi:hypothetical protein